MKNFRTGAVLSLMLAGHGLASSSQADVDRHVQIIERAPVLLTETVVKSSYIYIPQTTTVQVIVEVPASPNPNTTSPAIDAVATDIPGPDAPAPDAPASDAPAPDVPASGVPAPDLVTDSTSAATSVVEPVADTQALPTVGPEETPLFASIQPSFLNDEIAQSTELPNVAETETLPETTTSGAEPTSEALPTEVVPETVSETLPETTLEILPETSLETTSEAILETATETTVAPTTESVTESVIETTSGPATEEVTESIADASTEVSTGASTKALTEALTEAVTQASVNIPTATSILTGSQTSGSSDNDEPAKSTQSLSETDSDEFLAIDSGVPPTVSQTMQTRVRTTASAPYQSGDLDNFQPILTTATLSNGVVTTINLAATTGTGKAGETEGASAGVVDGEKEKEEEEEEPAATPVVVGSIVGSVMGLSVLVFFVWFVKRRTIRRRRSTLLTPLDWPANGPASGAAKYEIDNNSLGPTPRSTKLAAAVSVGAKKFGDRLRQSMYSLSHTDMNRGNSQYDEDAVHEQGAPVKSNHAPASAQSQQDWWATRDQPEEKTYSAVPRDVAEREAISRGRTPSPNPFSDPRLMSGSLTPPPLAISRPSTSGSSFSGNNGQQPTTLERLPSTTYVRESRKTRSQSTDRSVYAEPSMVPSQLAIPTVYRERDNIHSNPFDLDYDGHRIPSVSNIPTNNARYTSRSSFYSTARPLTTHSRHESFTSRYTSGVSGADRASFDLGRMSKWGGPGGYPPPPPPARHSRSESDFGPRYAA